MSPEANDEHQQLALYLAAILGDVAGWGELGEVRPGINISDREKGWKSNFRVPDAAVFLKGTRAKNCGTHWRGGPDFLVEIVSPNDRSRDKLPFYAGIKTREVLIVDRKPWSLELYRLEDRSLKLVEKCSPGDGGVVSSVVLPLEFGLKKVRNRVRIEVTRTDGPRTWLI